MDRQLFFCHAFLHRKSTALAAMRSEYRLIPQKRADEKRHAVLRSNARECGLMHTNTRRCGRMQFFCTGVDVVLT